MHYFNGFSLKEEKHFFDAYILDSEYSVCGFSYGAIKALKFTLHAMKEGKRVDRLILLSPAFFQTHSTKFKKLQLLSYRKDKELYLQNFLKACFVPHAMKKTEHYETDVTELEELLGYEWSLAELVALRERGIIIEVYLGAKDGIIDAMAALEFFRDVATVTFIQNANHFLQTN